MSKVVLKRPTTSGKTLAMIKKINKKHETPSKLVRKAFPRPKNKPQQNKLVKKVVKKTPAATKKKVVKKTVIKKPKKQQAQVLEVVEPKTESIQTELDNETQS